MRAKCIVGEAKDSGVLQYSDTINEKICLSSQQISIKC